MRVAMVMERCRRGGTCSHETTGEFHIDVIQGNCWCREDVRRGCDTEIRGRKISRVEFVRDRWKKRMMDRACVRISLAWLGAVIIIIQVHGFVGA